MVSETSDLSPLAEARIRAGRSPHVLATAYTAFTSILEVQDANTVSNFP